MDTQRRGKWKRKQIPLLEETHAYVLIAKYPLGPSHSPLSYPSTGYRKRILVYCRNFPAAGFTRKIKPTACSFGQMISEDCPINRFISKSHQERNTPLRKAIAPLIGRAQGHFVGNVKAKETT